MEIQAFIKTDSINPEAVAKSLQADNVTSEGISINTTATTQVETKITTKSLSTMIATIDDLISCQMTSEKVIHNG